MGVRRLACRCAVGSLTATTQVTRCSEQHESVESSEAFPGIAVMEVSTPALGPAVDVVNHLADRNEAPLGSGQLPELIVGTGHRLA